MTKNRRELAYRIRLEAAQMARLRTHPEHRSNSDEDRYASANYAMSFTKGLKHDTETGLVSNPHHFEAFRKAINEGFIDQFTFNVPVPPLTSCNNGRRHWEAPTAGIAYDLEGPDAQAVTMPPAPELGSDELAYEMAEVYELALLRDVPLSGFSGVGTTVGASVDRLNELQYRKKDYPGRPRKTDANGDVTAALAFRGSSPGVEIGPYLSQFLLIGTLDQPGENEVSSGRIAYGALTIDQRVPVANQTNYMTTFEDWLEVQDGCDVRDNGALFKNVRRFITTPRDLATYVHDDALYEAYLNACLILLAMESPFDPAFDNLSGLSAGRPLFASSESHPRQAGGFALYGGPHILTLVTEVATRALKAVRYQKFNNHLRLRPEALAARIEKAEAIESRFPNLGSPFSGLKNAIEDTVSAVRTQNGGADGTVLLPMAFQEGSPMHPSYGAGHATVAGACVTMLKAYFDTSSVFATPSADAGEPDSPRFKRFQKFDSPAAFVPGNDGTELEEFNVGTFLTLEGELNKLAANISIGRNMAGVHYFSDYYDSLRMGEQIAIGLLEEQGLCYPTDPFMLTLPTFDGQMLRIGTR